MNLEIKAVFEEGIEVLADMRVQFVLDLHPDYAPKAAAIREAILRYMDEHLRQNRYIGYLASVDGRAASSAGLLLYDLPPLQTTQVRRVGHVLNFFTVPAFRRQGIGRQLMAFMQADAKQRGLVRLVLNATQQGEPLYREAGFREQDEVHLAKTL